MAAIIVAMSIYINLNRCDCNDRIKEVEVIEKKIHVYEHKISESKKILDKKKKLIQPSKTPEPVIKTEFDSTATIDTVKIELVKSIGIIEAKNDTIHALREVVSIQDTIISDQDSLIVNMDKVIEIERNEAKKERRKKRAWVALHVIKDIAIVASFIILL